MTTETPRKYVRLEDGTPTDENDLDRGLWYGACTYWTDDWSKLGAIPPGIPCCPHCNAVGFQTTAGKWFAGVAKYQAEGNPGYVNFVKQSAEQCVRPLTFMEWFKQWLLEHPNGRDTNPRSDGS